MIEWLKTVVGATLGGLAILWIVGGYYHVRYYVLRRAEPETWKIQAKRFLRPDQLRQATRLSSMNLTIGGVITGTMIWGLGHGLRMPIYFHVEDHGWLYTVAITPVLFIVIDGLAYYAHRALHAPVMFRLFHRWHHRYVATTPFVVTAMHPVEFLIFQTVTFVPLFIIPAHYVSVILVFVYVFVFNIVDHSGVRLHSRLPWQGPSTFHDDHHAHFHCNFGQHLMLWDRMHGTLRRVGRTYGKDVFGGKGAPGAAPSAADEFVKY